MNDKINTTEAAHEKKTVTQKYIATNIKVTLRTWSELNHALKWCHDRRLEWSICTRELGWILETKLNEFDGRRAVDENDDLFNEIRGW